MLVVFTNPIISAITIAGQIIRLILSQEKGEPSAEECENVQTHVRPVIQ